MTEATIFLFKAIIDVISVAVVITFFFRLLRVDYYNPLVQGMLKYADIFTSTIRAGFKPIIGIDLASLIVTVILQAFCFYLISLSDILIFTLGTMISWSLFSVLLIGLTVIWWALIIGLIISCISPSGHHPANLLLL